MKNTIVVLCMILSAPALQAGDFDRLYKFMVDNNLKGLESSLKTKADANAADSNEYSLLMYAAMMGRMDFTRALLEKGADVNCTTGNGQNALTMTAGAGQFELFKYLVEKGARLKGNGMNSLLPSISSREKVGDGHVKIIEFLLAKGLTLDDRDDANATPLMVASERGNLQLVTLYLSKGADPNDFNRVGQTALMLSAMRTTKARTAVISALLKAGAKIDAQAGAGSGCQPCRKATPIMYAILAAGGGQPMIECVRVFIAAKADLTKKNASGKTVLMLAEERRESDRAYAEVVRMLKEAGAKE